MRFPLFSLLNAAVILSPSFAEESTRLLLVQSLFRHGDRTPMFTYPNDPNKLNSWPEGLGKLTQLGKKQLYAVGKFLRTMYKDFLTSNPNEVFATSSETDRSISSVQVHLAAVYEPEGKWKFEDKLDWQPIPIYTLPIKEDKYLSFNSTCPRAKAINLKSIKSLQMMEELRQYQAMMETVSHHVGYNISQGINALWLYDTLMVEKIHNLTFPEWADTYWEQLGKIAEISFHYVLNRPLFLKLRVGPLIQKITETMKTKINGKTPDLKYVVYSAHDVNVGGVLTALNFTDIPRPPYCATLLFELHEMADATMTVRILYLNSTNPLKDIGRPHVLVLDDCSEFCPLENFIKKTQHWIPDNWEHECQLDVLDACEADNTCENIRSDIGAVHRTDEL